MRELLWKEVRESIYPILLPQRTAKKCKLLWRPWMDLAICYRYARQEGGDSIITCEGIEEDREYEAAIFRQAWMNLDREMFTIKTIPEMVAELFGSEAEPADTEMASMWVLTNKQRNFGAAAMLSSEVMKKAANGRNLYIFPSSIHEVIFVEADESLDRRWLDHIVQEINAEIVAPEERLADHVYYYGQEKGEVEMID